MLDSTSSAGIIKKDIMALHQNHLLKQVERTQLNVQKILYLCNLCWYYVTPGKIGYQIQFAQDQRALESMQDVISGDAIYCCQFHLTARAFSLTDWSFNDTLRLRGMLRGLTDIGRKTVYLWPDHCATNSSLCPPTRNV